ncbi:hypothetical protein ZWY2020_006128 [Hordeum vulgare]|nr:hypothetical protein ZWY2020_006128 [Hordeum vulgare]
MWHYSGPEDSTRSHPEEVSEETVDQWLKSITGPYDNPVGAKRVAPYSVENKPLNLEWTNMHSPIPNRDQFEIGGESEGGSVESDYADDSEERKDDSGDSEEENQSLPRPESWSKHRHDPKDAPSKTLASISRNMKRDRAVATDSAEKCAKQPKPGVPKSRKALPRMRIVVPVASTAPTGCSPRE